MRVAVAVSGGRDSTALLHCTLRQARDLGIEVQALHVHHGLMPQADAWVRHLRRQVGRWAREGWPVTLRVTQLDRAPASGESIEAWARRERYAALASMAREAGCRAVLLGHHRQDQAETVLLQLLRRSQPGALAAMGKLSLRHDVLWLRPWLGHEPSAIAAYAKRHRLGYVEDPSNQDPRFLRGRLRQGVWPAVVAAFPEAARALGESARQMALWREVIEQEVTRDLAQVADAAGLDVARWRELSAPRRELTLRAWLSQRGWAAAQGALAGRLMRELPVSRSARWPLPGGAGELRLYRGLLQPHPISPIAASVPPDSLDLSRPGVHRFAGLAGQLHVELTDGPGVPLHQLACVQWRKRRGGERFQLAPDRPRRSLKKQYQAAGMPWWQRHLPLLWQAGTLLFVPGLGLDAGSVRTSGPQRAVLRWTPDVSEEQGGEP